MVGVGAIIAWGLLGLACDTPSEEGPTDPDKTFSDVTIPGWPNETVPKTIVSCSLAGQGASVWNNDLAVSGNITGEPTPPDEKFLVSWAVCNQGKEKSAAFSYQFLITMTDGTDTFPPIGFDVPEMDPCKCDAFYQDPSYVEFNNAENPGSIELGPGLYEFSLSAPLDATGEGFAFIQ
jgi:hypothetical protein